MAATDKRCAGTVKWFSARKGFGFIAPDDGSEDLFVHQTSIQSDGFRTLSDGQPVEYSVELGEDGRAKASEVVGVSRSRSTSRGRGSAGGRRGFAGGRGRRSGRYSSGGGGGYGRGWWGGRSEAAAAGGGGGGGGACYNCGRYGHLARDCYQGTGGGGGGGGSRRYGGGGGGCYSCGDEGHFARDCPNTDRN